jgi:hypothetical protein
MPPPASGASPLPADGSTTPPPVTSKRWPPPDVGDRVAEAAASVSRRERDLADARDDRRVPIDRAPNAPRRARSSYGRPGRYQRTTRGRALCAPRLARRLRATQRRRPGTSLAGRAGPGAHRGTRRVPPRPGRVATLAVAPRRVGHGGSSPVAPMGRPGTRRRFLGRLGLGHQAQLRQRAATSPVVRAQWSAKRTVVQAMRCRSGTTSLG